jgi:hypothetical protein
MMSPHDIEIKDICNVFFDTVSRTSNTRYPKSQELALQHEDEDHDINCALMVLGSYV